MHHQRLQPRGKHSPHFKGYGDMPNRYVSECKRRAKKKKIKFSIDAKFLWNLYIKQKKKCALSGVPLVFSVKNKIRKIRDGNASIDRINSKKGYTKDNVQWVHKTVNMIKYKLSEKEFLKWCNIIVKNN